MDPHPENLVFSCPVKSCSYKSESKREFNAHKLAHDGINSKRWLPYSCPQCPARFHSNEDQAVHAALQGPKSFWCSKCPEAFYFEQGLDMHYEQAHAQESPQTNPRPFQCPHCDHICKTPLGLEMHLRWRYMGACLAKIDDAAAPLAQGDHPHIASAESPRHEPFESCRPASVCHMSPNLSGASSNPVYAPVPTPSSALLVTPVPGSLAPTPRGGATPVQAPMATLNMKSSLNQLAAAVAANYQEMLSPTNSTDTALGGFTPEDARSKFSSTPTASHHSLGFVSNNVSFRSGVVTPLSMTSPSSTPLSMVSRAGDGQNGSFGSPNLGELSPSSRLSGRNDELHKQATCPECLEQFSSRELLSYHLRTVHFVPLSSERKFECKICLKVCTTQSGLDYHNRTHLKSIEERRAYKCQECSQVFTVRSTLYRHQRTQHAATLDERKPYKCVYCGKAFASRYNLNRHADTRHPGLVREALK